LIKLLHVVHFINKSVKLGNLYVFHVDLWILSLFFLGCFLESKISLRSIGGYGTLRIPIKLHQTSPLNRGLLHLAEVAITVLLVLERAAFLSSSYLLLVLGRFEETKCLLWGLNIVLVLDFFFILLSFIEVLHLPVLVLVLVRHISNVLVEELLISLLFLEFFVWVSKIAVLIYFRILCLFYIMDSTFLMFEWINLYVIVGLSLNLALVTIHFLVWCFKEGLAAQLNRILWASIFFVSLCGPHLNISDTLVDQILY